LILPTPAGILSTVRASARGGIPRSDPQLVQREACCGRWAYEVKRWLRSGEEAGACEASDPAEGPGRVEGHPEVPGYGTIPLPGDACPALGRCPGRRPCGERLALQEAVSAARLRMPARQDVRTPRLTARSAALRAAASSSMCALSAAIWAWSCFCGTREPQGE
jgi:hypothetical protein